MTSVELDNALMSSNPTTRALASEVVELRRMVAAVRSRVGPRIRDYRSAVESVRKLVSPKRQVTPGKE